MLNSVDSSGYNFFYNILLQNSFFFRSKMLSRVLALHPFFSFPWSPNVSPLFHVILSCETSMEISWSGLFVKKCWKQFLREMDGKRMIYANSSDSGFNHNLLTYSFISAKSLDCHLRTNKYTTAPTLHKIKDV